MNCPICGKVDCTGSVGLACGGASPVAGQDGQARERLAVNQKGENHREKPTMKKTYQILFDNGHASNLFPTKFTNKRKAEQFARELKSEMVNIEDSPKHKKEARQAYQWELITSLEK